MPSPQSEPEQIQPVDFRPGTATGGGPRWQPRWPRLLFWLGALLLLLCAGFLFTAVPIEVELDPAADEVDFDGGLVLPVGDRLLVRPGELELDARLEGYHPLQETITVTRDGKRRFGFAFTPLPGRIDITTTPEVAARVRVDGADVGQTPLEALELEPGSYRLTLESDRYLTWEQSLEVEGRGQEQSVVAELEPAWATIELTTEPSGATITTADGTELGTSPARFELLQGRHTLTAKKAGHKAWQTELDVTAGEPQQLGPITLEPADGLVLVRTQPAGAALTVNGEFQGRTPLELELEPDTEHRLVVFRPGYERLQRRVQVGSGEEQELDLRLQAETGEVSILVTPEDATLRVDGEARGNARQTLSLPAVTHEIEISKPGYVPFRTRVTPRPGYPQEIELRLQTVEEARRASIKSVIETAEGQRMNLLRPGAFTMGASRREPGRRANEVLRDVRLTRPFYLAETEVTNAEFRRFASGHESGEWENQSLDDDDQPVVNISWQEAALYANWLSEQDGLPKAYLTRNGQVTGFDPEATGYRLPTEAEWAWAARVQPDGSTLRFPWGDDMPPPERSGNYADRAVSHLLGRTIIGYTDGHVVSAPVASYDPNRHDLHDMGGNVAEWVNDFYAPTSEDLPSGVVDPLGPDGGDYHVIRGASWMHGTLTELRLSFRDYGTEGRNDLGFRLARFLE